MVILLLEEIASHGYIVINLNHPSSSSCAPFSEGAFNPNIFEPPANFQQEIERISLAQVENVRFVLTQVQTGNLSSLPKNYSGRVFVAGHSLGGATSIRVARNNPFVAGCMNLDGRLTGPKETKTDGLKIPVLVLTTGEDRHTLKEEHPHFSQAREIWAEYETFFANSTRPILMNYVDLVHEDFCSSRIISYLSGNQSAGTAIKAHRIASRAMVQLMNSANPK